MEGLVLNFPPPSLRPCASAGDFSVIAVTL
jgi:hypothetical protein